MLNLLLTLPLFLIFRWSEYGNGANDDNDNSCGADGGDEHWYMGRTQCFRANVAYSLYGVKSNGSSGNSKCHKSHYINSFFTTGGFEAFADPFGIDYANSGASSQCQYQQVGDNEDGNDNNDGGNRDHNQMLYQDYVSYGTGCSVNGGFIQAKFQGAFCDGNHYDSTVASYSDLDGYFQDVDCQQVYDSNGNYQANENNNNNNNGNNGDIPGSDSIAFQILSYSSVCSTIEYPQRCPDPYGVKATRDEALSKAAKAHFRKVPLIMPILTAVFFVAGAVLFFLSRKIEEEEKIMPIDDPMASARSAEEPHFLQRTYESFARTASQLSQRTQSIKERLQDYAEEENEDWEDVDGTYDAPDPPTPPKEPVKETVYSTETVYTEPTDKAALTEEQAKNAALQEQLAQKDGELADKDAALKAEQEKLQAEQAKKDAQAKNDAALKEEPVIVSNADVANAILAEKGITPPPKAEAEKKAEEKKYKRPLLARISKRLFGRRKKNKNKN